MEGDTPIRTSVIRTSETPRDEFDWGTTAWSVGAAAGNSNSLTFGKVTIRAGQANPRHRHDNCDEILYLLSGTLEHYADDVGAAEMAPGGAIFIPAGVAHNARCTSERDAEMIVVYSSPRRRIAPA